MSAWPEPPRLIAVDDDTLLRPVFDIPVKTFYALVDRNRTYLGRYLEFATPDYSLEDAETYTQRSSENWGSAGEQSYAILHRGDVSGTIGLHHYGSKNRAVEIGYWLDSGLQGNGIMTRCVLAMTRMAFDHLGVNQIVIGVDFANERSRAIAERTGYRLDGVTRQWLVNAAGELADMARYSMLRDERPGETT